MHEKPPPEFDRLPLEERYDMTIGCSKNSHAETANTETAVLGKSLPAGLAVR
jgi:hypothetical protein